MTPDQRHLARRRFLRSLAAAGISLPALPALGGLSRSVAEEGAVEARSPADTTSKAGRSRHLVLVELQGGNDGLNTVAPYADPSYRRLRPTLALTSDQVAVLDESAGLHPALASLWTLWKRGDLAIVEGVGYPKPNRSHFRSIEIWETAADADETLLDGWLVPLTRQLPATETGAIRAVALAADEGPLAGTVGDSIVLQDVERFLRQARRLENRALANVNPALAHVLSVERTARRAALEFSRHLEASLTNERVSSEDPRFVRQLDAVARLITEDAGPQVWKVGLGSFDTHVNQLTQHATLLGQLAAGIERFHGVLDGAGRWNDVVLVTYSEFGRRAAENGSGGTDHGTAAPHFFVGGAVRGGLYGARPSIDRLRGSDPVFTTDFRSLYSTIAVKWFGQSVRDTPYARFDRIDLFQ